MKRLDTLLQRYRQRAVLKYLPSKGKSVFDIGCQDGSLMDQLSSKYSYVYGCDPQLPESKKVRNKVFISLPFPSALKNVPEDLKFNVFSALAVFEHMQPKDIAESGIAIASRMEIGGILVATVPSPIVDHIIHLLMFFRLIDGQEAHQHYGFVPKDLIKIFEGSLRLVRHQRFQLGLNNLFVFEKVL